MPEPNVANRTLYHGDNLDFLRGMNSGTVHLIATDPPFNKGKDFHATPDSLAAGAKFQDRWSWADDVEGEWIDQIQDDWPAVWEVIDAARAAWGDDMAAFLCFMGVRLIEMRRVLRDDGSLYLHCDPTASHYLKALLDATFGKRQFRNEIVWFYKTGGVSRRWFGKKHDSLMFYSKTDSYAYNPQKEKSYLSHKYGFSNIQIHEDQGGFFTMVGMRDVWDIPALRGNQPEATGFPTQKPLALYERIIAASSNPGNVVLDPFCGCATTPVAAERLGRKWVGVDIWDGAHDVVLKRLQAEGLATPGRGSDRLFTFGDVTYTTEPPSRTDGGIAAVPFLQVTERYAEPGGPRMSRAAMYEYLLAQHGPKCQGCDRTFDDPRYLELDHNTPRSDGGLNHITNRILLCGPCNRLKSNQYTLSGLRRQNQRLGYMANGYSRI